VSSLLGRRDRLRSALDGRERGHAYLSRLSLLLSKTLKQRMQMSDDDRTLMCVYIRLTVGSVNRRCSTSAAARSPPTSQPPSTAAAGTTSTQLFSSGYISSPNYPARYERLPCTTLYSVRQRQRGAVVACVCLKGAIQNLAKEFSFLANVNSSSRSLYVIDGPSVCLSSFVCLSVTFVRPTQAIEIFGNISTPCGTVAIHDLCIKILRRSSQGNPSVGGLKHKRVSRI